MKKFIFAVLFVLPSFAVAELINCGEAEIKQIIVQSDREGTHGHENKTMAQFYSGGSDILCAGKNYVFIANDDPAHSGILSVLLSAQATNRAVKVFVNSSVIAGGNAVQIAFVSLAN